MADTTIAPAKRSNFVQGAMWMVGAVISFTVMAVSGKAVMSELDTFELMMYRSFTGVIIVVAYVILSHRGSEITTEKLGAHVVRNLFHFSGQNLWFAAILMIPIAKVFAIEFTSPIWVLLLSPLVLGESLTRSRAMTAFAGFIGILIVTRPSFSSISLGEILAAVAAICFATTNLLTRRLTRTQSITAILFYLTVLQAIFGIVMSAYDGEVAVPSMGLWPYVVAVGVAGLMAHLCLTRALSLAPAAAVMPIDFARLPVIAIVGYVLYNESIDIYAMIGAMIIFGANYLNVVHEAKLTKAPPVL
ncbi:DMT family transporter [Falsihalocynthiibacter sp. SS001]|uniref:DMT family transporter n=1 Tax=Falsihalocynthiibacter sp. SS001 TaxID=3349698 RepID=UPI0036D3B5F7